LLYILFEFLIFLIIYIAAKGRAEKCVRK
jgi:hypothetical protein